MLRLWLLVLPLIVTCTARSQEHLRLRGGLAIGYRAFALPVRILDQERDTTLTPDAALSPWYGGMVGIDMPFVRQLQSTSWLQFDVSRSTSMHRRTVVFIRDSNATQGVIAQRHSTSLSSITAGTGLLFQPSPFFSVAAGVGAYLPFNMYLEVSEFVESPSGVTFLDGSTERQLGKSIYAGENVAAALVKASVQFAQPLSTRFDLLVVAHGDVALTSPITHSDWRPWSVGLSIQLGWKPTVQSESTIPEPSPPAVPPPQHRAARVERVSRDTITIIDPWQKGRIDTVWIDSKSAHVDTIKLDTIDSIVTSTHFRTERHLPHPPLFLSAVSDAEVVSTGNDSTLALDVKVVVTADTSTTTFIQVFHESTLVSSTVTTEPNSVNRITLSDVITDIAKRKELKLVIVANTIDAVGNQHASAPLRLEFFRTRLTSTFQRR